MVKENITYIDGSTHEVEISRLGFRKANNIARSHIPIKDLSFGENNTVSIKGDIDLLGMVGACLETVKGLDLDLLTGEDANRLYKTYFEKDVMGSLGQGGNPN